MDLFSSRPIQDLPGTPLAELLRPNTIDDVVGQEKAIGHESTIGKLIRKGQIPSLILWGPPGTGKTSFALTLSRQVDAFFVQINAVESGAKALREIGEAARDRRQTESRRTVLFVDEIHRFNKSQQDVLLPFIEKGDLILVGATTENPSYELNRALMSRCRLVVFERLNPSHLEKLFERACAQLKVNFEALLTPDAKQFLIQWADGDARRLLNATQILVGVSQQAGSTQQLESTQSLDLNLSLESAHERSSGFDIAKVEEILGSQVLGYDRASDQHYDVISAFIKSIRGSDPDAGLYYLARMLKGGEDPLFIARRLVILASEDVSNADPRALSVAVAGAQAVEMIGLPEAAINLAQVVTYLASAPKSNRSYQGLNRAKALVETLGTSPVPLSLRSAKTELMSSIGYGKDYQYPHSQPQGWVKQSYLPQEVQEAVDKLPLYEPADRGFEKNIREYLRWMKSEPK